MGVFLSFFYINSTDTEQVSYYRTGQNFCCTNKIEIGTLKKEEVVHFASQNMVRFSPKNGVHHTYVNILTFTRKRLQAKCCMSISLYRYNSWKFQTKMHQSPCKTACETLGTVRAKNGRV